MEEESQKPKEGNFPCVTLNIPIRIITESCDSSSNIGDVSEEAPKIHLKTPKNKFAKKNSIRRMITKMEENPKKFKQFTSGEDKHFAKSIARFGNQKSIRPDGKNIEEINQQNKMEDILAEEIILRIHEHDEFLKYEKDHMNDCKLDRSNQFRKGGQYSALMLSLESKLENMEEEERYEAAGRIFRDAVFSRTTRFYFPNRYVRFLYDWKTHPAWEALMIILSWSYVLLSFFENHYSGLQEYKPWGLQFWITISFELLIQICFILYNIIEIILRYTDKEKSKSESFFNLKFASRILTDLILFIDFILFFALYTSGTSYFRFGRLFRPLKIMFHSKQMRRNLVSIANCWYNILDVVILYMLTIFLFALLGIRMFSGAVDQDDITRDNDMTSFLPASLQLYILTTFANYPNIIDPYMNISGYYFFYFLPFMLLVLIFFIPIPVATIADKYGKNLVELLIQDRMKEKEAFFVVHCCLDIKGKETINKEEWVILCRKIYNNKQDSDKINNIFEFYDINNDGFLDIYEFFEACELMVCLESVNKAYIPELACWDWLREFCRERLKFKFWVTSVWFEVGIFILIMLNIIVILMEATTKDEETKEICIQIDYILLWFFATEIVLKILTLGLTDYFADPWNKFDFCLVVLSIIIASTISFMKMVRYLKSTKMLRTAGKAKALKGIKSCKIFRILASPFARIKLMFVILSINMPSLRNILNILFLWFYFFAICGIEAFHPENKNLKSSTYENSIVGGFENFSMALVALFQVLTQGSWHSLIFHYSETHNVYLTFWYFSTFHLGSVIVLLSLTCGIIWSVFNITHADKIESELADDGSNEQSEGDDSFRTDKSNDSNLSVSINTDKNITELNIIQRKESSHGFPSPQTTKEVNHKESLGIDKKRSAPNLLVNNEAIQAQRRKSKSGKLLTRPENVDVNHKFYWRQALISDVHKETIKKEEEEKMKGVLSGKVGQRLRVKGERVNYDKLSDEICLSLIRGLRKTKKMKNFQSEMGIILKKLHENIPKGSVVCAIHETEIISNNGKLISKLLGPPTKNVKDMDNFLDMDLMQEDIQEREGESFIIPNYLLFHKPLQIVTNILRLNQSRKDKLYSLFLKLGLENSSSIAELNKYEYAWNCIITPIIFNEKTSFNNINENIPTTANYVRNTKYKTQEPTTRAEKLAIPSGNRSPRGITFRGIYLVFLMPEQKDLKDTGISGSDQEGGKDNKNNKDNKENKDYALPIISQPSQIGDEFDVDLVENLFLDIKGIILNQKEKLDICFNQFYAHLMNLKGNGNGSGGGNGNVKQNGVA